ncbi:hypothetical protein [Viscerimonas tarda]
MKKLSYIFLCCFFASLILSSCRDNDDSPQNIVETKIPLYYKDITTADADTVHYEAVKIGEYLWMNRNFNHFTETEVTRAQLNKVLTEYRLNPNDFQVNIDDFNKYFGQYYSQAYIDHLNRFGYFYEGKERKLYLDSDNRSEWKFASKADFRQLFAMCGDASEYAVRIALTCKPYENPAAIPVPGTYWISRLNTNKYGFNAMPGGARHHAADEWGTCFGENDCPTFQNKKGDFYIFIMTTKWAASDGSVTIHDYVDTSGGKLWHLQNVRWCRKLRDEELGYKLYIKANNLSSSEWTAIANQYKAAPTDYIAETGFVSKIQAGVIKSNNVDIKKIAIGENAPNDYVELRKGYIRGFYVQYILNVAQPSRNVPQIIDMAKGLI